MFSKLSYAAPSTRNGQSFVFLIATFALILAASFGNYQVAAATQPANTPSRDAKPTGKSKFAKLDGNRVHYVNYGKGSDAIVLIHGWTMNADNWRDQIPALAERYRVIAIDLPGHGQSDKPKLSYSMDYFARAVEAVMRDAKVKRGVFVGHSMGTPVARQFYRQYAEKTLGIVIVDGLLRALADKAMMDAMINGFRGPTYRDTVGQMLASMYGPILPAEARGRISASTASTPQYVLVSAMEGMADPAIWGPDKINVPVLAVMAKNPFFGPDLETLFRGIAPNLEFHMWEGVGHFLMMDRPKEFNELVLKFLEKNHVAQRK